MQRKSLHEFQNYTISAGDITEHFSLIRNRQHQIDFRGLFDLTDT